jgi:hypothetical protein
MEKLESIQKKCSYAISVENLLAKFYKNTTSK